MNSRCLGVLLALGGLVFVAACGNDNDFEGAAPAPTNTSTRVPATDTPTLAPTNTATTVVLPTNTATPQVSPTNTQPGPTSTATTAPTPTQTGSIPAICGNNAVEAGEDCDDGNLWSGDGCAANCADEFAIDCTLGCIDVNENGKCGEFEGDPDDLDSGAFVVSELFPLSLLFQGDMTFTAGKPRDTQVVTVDPEMTFEPAEMPLVLKETDMRVKPISLPGVTCSCVIAVPTEDEYGPNNAGGGRFGCGESGIADATYLWQADHRINDIDPTCETGFLEDGTAEHPHIQPPLGPACNDVGHAVYTAGGPRGAVAIGMHLIINLLSDGGACVRDCSIPDLGPDCLPCTDDDLLTMAIINNVLVATTEGAMSRVLDANNKPGVTIEGKPLVGVRADCDGLMSDLGVDRWDMTGGALVNNIGLIDTPSLGDAAAAVVLACVPPEE